LLLILAWSADLAGHGESSRGAFRAFRYLLLVECLLLAVAMLIGAIYEQANRKRERSQFHPPGRLIDMGGYKLHLYCSGEGTPTVLLDFGLDGSYLDWYFVQPRVAQFTRVCSYDRGGYGWSDPSPRPRVPGVMVGELHTLLAKAGERPPYIVVGHSFGAFDALMFADRYREEVAGVVLVDGTHPNWAVPFPLRRKLWIRTLQFTAPLGLPRWRKWCGGNVPELAAIRTALNCRSKVYAATYAQSESFPQSAAEVRDLPPLGDLPLAVISRDPQRPASHTPNSKEWEQLQLKLAELSSRSVRIIAPGSGHEIPSARPDVIADTIQQMVEEARQ
jgi:pimeloyl-ACP methyl ester carboxylesterase